MTVTRTTVREPEWLPDDLEVVLEWTRYRDTLCDGCAQSLSESLDPALEGAYEADVVSCHGCAAREAAQKKARDVPGVKVAVHLVPEAVEFLRSREG